METDPMDEACYNWGGCHGEQMADIRDDEEQNEEDIDGRQQQQQMKYLATEWESFLCTERRK